MARTRPAQMTAGSVVATTKTAYIKTGDGNAPWAGTDGKQHDNAHIEKLLDNPWAGTALRLGASE